MLRSDLNELKVLTNRSNVVLLYNIYTLNVSVGPHQLRRLSWHPHDNKIVFFLVKTIRFISTWPSSVSFCASSSCKTLRCVYLNNE